MTAGPADPPSARPVPTDTRAAVFDEHISAWRSWQREPWALVRYAVVGHVLDSHIAGTGPMRVLDVGGGDGTDSLRLAEAGHDVTILDFSDAMLRAAHTRSSELGVLDSVHLVTGQVGELAELRLAGFDLVLCHFVIQYLADPTSAVADVVAATRPGGLVSLVAPNPVSEVLAKAVRGRDPLGALDLLTARSFHAAAFEHDVNRIEWRSAARDLRAAGADVVGRYGCRCVVDLVNDSVFTSDADHLADIVALETAVCAASPYRDIARAWQLVARRR